MSASLVRDVAAIVRDRYVVADLGLAAADALLADTALEQLQGRELAAAMSEVLQRSTSDRHLQVRHSVEELTASPTSLWDDPDYLARYWREQDAFNQGLSRVERLPGNIGLLVVHSLDEPEGTGPVIEAALAFIGRCDAVVIDVRDSNGGAPTGVAFLTSHFLDAPTRKLVTVVARDGSVVDQTSTSAYVRAPRFVRQPVFVLTSSTTPSGTEELAYGLQALGRARVVGERTVGAANPVELLVVGPHFLLRLPTVRVVHAATGGNWEGTGVIPDIACPAADALAVAHHEAARMLLDEPPPTVRPESVVAELRAIRDGAAQP